MSGFYDGFEFVAELLAEAGRPITLSRTTGGVDDPIEGTVTGATPTSIPANAVEYPYQTNEIDGTLVKAGDKRLYCDTEALIGDTTEGMRVVSVEPLKPGPTILMWTLQLRV